MVQGAGGDGADAVVRARDSFERHAWGDACAGFLAHAESLDAEDLERLAVCAYLVGRDQDSDAAWARAYRQRRAAGDVDGASRCAFWIGFRLVNAHERSEANGWIARLARLAEDAPEDSQGLMSVALPRPRTSPGHRPRLPDLAAPLYNLVASI